MTNNEIISEWRGEKLEEPQVCEEVFLNEYYDGWICDCGTTGSWADMDEPHLKPVKPLSDYENDPAAWDDKLYDEIEGLKAIGEKFFANLCAVNNGCICDGLLPECYIEISRIVTATPAQKAEALARAIEGALK